MPWRPPQNPLDKPLEEAVADSIAADLIDGNVYVIGHHDLAWRAALEGFRQGITLVEKIVDEMADDHAFGGGAEGRRVAQGRPPNRDAAEGHAVKERSPATVTVE